jgi:hypothetical protein
MSSAVLVAVSFPRSLKYFGICVVKPISKALSKLSLDFYARGSLNTRR